MKTGILENGKRQKRNQEENVHDKKMKREKKKSCTKYMRR